MRIRIVFDLKDKKISVKYHSQLQGIIYNCLPFGTETKLLHDEGYKIGKRKFKLFTYSELYGPCKYNPLVKKLEFSGNGCLDFTSADSNIVKSVVDFIEQNKTVVFGGQIIKILKYDILDDECSRNNVETYYTLSPVVIEKMKSEKQSESVDVPSEQFETNIINNLAQKYYLVFNENMPNIKITEISNIKLKRVWFENMLYNANHMNITFDNLTPQVKYIILTCGIGTKNSMGFGMVSKKL